MSFDSIRNLIIDEEPDFSLLCTTVVLVAGCLGLCWLYPCLPDLYSSRQSDEPYYGTDEAKITTLYVYPVKSCAGHQVQSARVTPTGLLFDRTWMVIGENNRFRSQRQIPKMALIEPNLPSHDSEPLVLKAPGMTEIRVPVIRQKNSGSKVISVGIWSDTCEGIDQGDEVAEWLSTYLGEPGLRLVRMEDTYIRSTNPKYGEGFRTSFSDAFPALLLSEESIDDLNARLPTDSDTQIPINRFRPNIVVSVVEAWAEDDWTKVSMEGLVARVVKPCDRCQIPNIDQSTGVLPKERNVTRLLETFRRGDLLGFTEDDKKNEVFVGQNLLFEGGGVLRVGDSIEVLRVRKMANTRQETREKED